MHGLGLIVQLCLYKYGLFFVGNVKTAHKRFPKTKLKSLLKGRGSHVHMKVKVPGEDFEVYGSAHQDVQPMVLVHTAGTSLPGKARLRRWAKYSQGKILKKVYKLEQPHVHAIYRESFSAVDIFNKIALGPHSVSTAFKSKLWTHRFWASLVAMSETNAYLVHKQRCLSQQTPVRPKDHSDWKEELAWNLIHSVTRDRAKAERPTTRFSNNPAYIGRLGLPHTQLQQT